MYLIASNPKEVERLRRREEVYWAAAAGCAGRLPLPDDVAAAMRAGGDVAAVLWWAGQCPGIPEVTADDAAAYIRAQADAYASRVRHWRRVWARATGDAGDVNDAEYVKAVQKPALARSVEALAELMKWGGVEVDDIEGGGGGGGGGGPGGGAAAAWTSA